MLCYTWEISGPDSLNYHQAKERLKKILSSKTVSWKCFGGAGVRGLERRIPYCFWNVFSSVKICKTRDSSPVLGIQFNSRSAGLLTGVVEEAVTVPASSGSLAYLRWRLCKIAPCFSSLLVLFCLNWSTLKSVLELSLTLIMIVRITGLF